MAKTAAFKTLATILLLGVGVPATPAAGPIGRSRADGQRVCATLCAAGLGGAPCGGVCRRIQPDDFPRQSGNGSAAASTTHAATLTRRDACPILCRYQLGEPLCGCQRQAEQFDSIFFDVDFESICAFFCLQHSRRLQGCPRCEVYKEDSMQSRKIWWNGGTTGIDWEAWCRDRCAVGDGGVACNCDLIPIRAAA